MGRSRSSRHVSVAIIGAGFGGIATAVRLKRAGFDDFVVFEKSAGPGGTWWDNTYPGCEVDVPSHVYSFSFFIDFEWSRTHARQPELQRYAEETIDRFGLRSHFRFCSEVTSSVWDEANDRYDVTLASGETASFTVVVGCLGMLNVPRYPDWPGLETFAGPRFHTARWDHSVDLTGKRVAVVGTGSTAAQVVPAVAPTVERLLVFQRQPGWVIPKGEREFTVRERARFRRHPWLIRLERYAFFVRDHHFANNAFEIGTRVNRKMLETSLRLLDTDVADPDLRRRLRPDYPWGCKRAVIATTFYAALNRPNVTLVPSAVSRVTERGLVDEAGAEHEIDVLVMSTGFQPYNSFAELDVVGPGGRSLRDIWDGSPEAFLGITVAGIPNFFMLYGPNTNGASSIITQLELQADVVVRTAKRMRRHGLAVVETRPTAMRRFVRWVDRRNREMQSAGFAGCTNYYFSSKGRNVTQWPSSHAKYLLMTRLLPRLGLVVRRERSKHDGQAQPAA